MPATVPRLALIGYGNAGRWIHAPLIAATPGLQLAGVCSRDPDRRAQASADWSCRSWQNYESVLADPDVDVVVLATPTAAHAEQALAALESGKHVLVDKPVCLDVATLDRLAEAERTTGRSLTVFHNRRWDGDFATIKRLLTAGVLGRPLVIEMAWGAYGRPRGWRANRDEGGGRVYDLGTHMIDQLCLLMPSAPRQVHARMHPPLPGMEVESFAHLVIGFADGATGVVETGYIASLDKPRFRVVGLEKSFEKRGLDPQELALRGGDVEAAREDPDSYGWLSDGTTRTRVPTVHGHWRGLYEELREHLNGHGPNPVTIQSVRPTAAIIAAAFRSVARSSVESL